MNFRPELVEQILAGRKTQTRRRMSDNPRSPWYRGGCSLHAGRVYALCPGRGKTQVGKVVVEGVREVRLGDLTIDEAIAEGFESVGQFRGVWRTLNGDYDPNEQVWAITFYLLCDCPDAPARHELGCDEHPLSFKRHDCRRLGHWELFDGPHLCKKCGDHIGSVVQADDGTFDYSAARRELEAVHGFIRKETGWEQSWGDGEWGYQSTGEGWSEWNEVGGTTEALRQIVADTRVGAYYENLAPLELLAFALADRASAQEGVDGRVKLAIHMDALGGLVRAEGRDLQDARQQLVEVLRTRAEERCRV